MQENLNRPRKNVFKSQINISEWYLYIVACQPISFQKVFKY